MVVWGGPGRGRPHGRRWARVTGQANATRCLSGKWKQTCLGLEHADLRMC